MKPYLILFKNETFLSQCNVYSMLEKLLFKSSFSERKTKKSSPFFEIAFIVIDIYIIYNICIIYKLRIIWMFLRVFLFFNRFSSSTGKNENSIFEIPMIPEIETN